MTDAALALWFLAILALLDVVGRVTPCRGCGACRAAERKWREGRAVAT